MSDSKNQTQGVVDFGTSPHGLPADLRRPHQETLQADGHRSLEDGFDLAAAAAADGGATADAAGQPTSLTFTFTEEQRSAVSFALLNEICWLEECDEFPHPDILEAIHYLSGAREILEGRPA